MHTKDEWVQLPGVNIISDREAKTGEKVSAFVLCRTTGFVLEKITYEIRDSEKNQYTWPKFFSDEINRKSLLTRAGEKNDSEGFDTLWSSYRNRLWQEPGSDIEIFTTSLYLGNWADIGVIASSSDVPPGMTIAVEVKHISKKIVYETLNFFVAPDMWGQYAWPYHLSCFINAHSDYIRAGEKNEDNCYIVPLYSGYRNRIWQPQGASLKVELKWVVPAAFYTDMTESFARLFASIAVTPPDQNVVERWVQSITQGKFNDLSYPSQNAGNNVAPLQEHLGRISKILKFARRDSVTYKHYYTLAAEAIAFYASSDFQTSNWWDRHIGLAKAAAECLVLLAENSPPAHLLTAVDYLKGITHVAMGQTGANQADYAYVQLCWALSGWKISSSDFFVFETYAASTALSVICLPVARHGVEQGGGISVDYSFSSHNVQEGKFSQIYAGTYGYVFLSNIFKFVNLLSGFLALRAQSLRQIERFLLEGMGWFGHAGVYDFHVCGRGISRGMEGNRTLAAWCQTLLAHNPANPQALSELIKRAAGDEANNIYYQGVRTYWINDYLCYFDQEVAFWFKAISTRTVGSESGNGENLKGYYVGCGSYFISRDSHEYLNIQPLWDWQRIPGTTVEQVPDFIYPLIEWGNGAWGSHDYSGVMGDGRVGVASMILSRKNVVNAKKTVIALSGSLVFMGSSIDTLGANFPVVTSVNQTLRRGPIIIVYRDGRQESLASGQRRGTDILEVTHDGLSYVFGTTNNQTVTVDTSMSTGTWNEINKGKSTDVLQGEVFSVWLEHQKGPDERYCYEIRPVEPGAQRENTIVTNSIESHVLTCDDARFAAGVVYPGSDCDIQLEHVTFKCLTPLAFIARNPNNSVLELTIADLSQLRVEAELWVDWGHTQYRKTIPLPAEDDLKGQSLSVVLTPR